MAETSKSLRDDPYAINRRTLKFLNKDVERECYERYLKDFIAYAPYMFLIYIVIPPVAGVLEFFTTGTNVAYTLAIRIGIALPLTLLFYFIMFFNRRWMLEAALAIHYVIGFAVIAVSMFVSLEFHHTYYWAATMIAIAAVAVIRLHYLRIVVMYFILFIAYLLVLIFVLDAPMGLIGHDIAFTLIAAVIIGVTSYSLEYGVKNNYIKEQLIIAEKLKYEAASRAKTEFLAVMSHELRTPLNAIIGFSEMIDMELLGPITPPKYKEYASDIHESGVYLQQLIQDILDLSRAEIGKLKMEETDFKLANVFTRCGRMLAEKASEKILKLDIDEASAAYIVHADERLLFQLLVNVVGNSVKFTNVGGHIWVSAARNERGELGIQVKDDGIGISKEDLPKIAKPFVQVASALKREQGGAGIGLALVKKIIELHDGRLDIQSELGKGTTVTAYLPKERVIGEGVD